ncbi:UNVERIFIED_ORG: hypothetical protein GGI63_000122 [Rhizobium esperanzae]
MAKTICSFVPTADTILALLKTGSPELAAASGIAKAICAAVAPPGEAQRASGTVYVSGVPIKGAFEKK